MANPSKFTVLLANKALQTRKEDATLLRELKIKNIITVQDGTEAWSAVNDQAIDLVMADWHLNEMNGLTLLRVIRADPSHGRLPFVMLLSDATKKQVVEACRSGVDEIILRPYDAKMLKKKIEKALEPIDDPQIRKSDQLYSQGLELMQEGKFEEALESFEQVLDVHEDAEIYYNLGYIRTAQEKYEEAILAFRRATMIDNAFANAYKSMAEVYAKLNKPDEAQDCFEKAAEIYMDKNQDDYAESAFMQAIKLSPKTANVYNSLGILYRRQGKLNESVAMYRKAIKVSPNDENVIYNLARVLMAVKNFRDAAKALRKALQLNPDFIEASDLLQSLEMGSSLE